MLVRRLGFSKQIADFAQGENFLVSELHFLKTGFPYSMHEHECSAATYVVIHETLLHLCFVDAELPSSLGTPPWCRVYRNKIESVFITCNGSTSWELATGCASTAQRLHEALSSRGVTCQLMGTFVTVNEQVRRRLTPPPPERRREDGEEAVPLRSLG